MHETVANLRKAKMIYIQVSCSRDSNRGVTRLKSTMPGGQKVAGARMHLPGGRRSGGARWPSRQARAERDRKWRPAERSRHATAGYMRNVVTCHSSYALADPEGGQRGQIQTFAGQNVFWSLHLKTDTLFFSPVFKGRGLTTFWPANF